jgi:hypothetical protein
MEMVTALWREMKMERACRKQQQQQQQLIVSSCCAATCDSKVRVHARNSRVAADLLLRAIRCVYTSA